jgi:hypothetical protein
MATPPDYRGPGAVTAKKDDAPAAVHGAMFNVADLDSISGGGGLIQTTSGWCQQRIDRDHRLGFSRHSCFIVERSISDWNRKVTADDSRMTAEVTLAFPSNTSQGVGRGRM